VGAYFNLLKRNLEVQFSIKKGFVGGLHYLKVSEGGLESEFRLDDDELKDLQTVIADYLDQKVLDAVMVTDTGYAFEDLITWVEGVADDLDDEVQEYLSSAKTALAKLEAL
jgi:hypothetical protein